MSEGKLTVVVSRAADLKLYTSRDLQKFYKVLEVPATQSAAFELSIMLSA